MINEDCPNYECKDCKHYKSAHLGGCTKRVDHKTIEFSAPWFRCDPENCHTPCCEFEPSKIHIWDLKNYWTNWENWWNDYVDTWLEGHNPYNELIYFTLNGNTNVRYGVPMMDYVMGNMYNGNNLKAVEKMYYKRTQKGFGYKLIREKINGVELCT